jgi:2-hydroxychromene-2-carboxylate isomerase
MPPIVDLFFSFRSPYSYLATPEARQLAADFDVGLRLRPVLPIAVRDPGSLFTPDNAKRLRCIQLDWPRRAEMLGLPHAWPSPDPIVQDMQTFAVASEQPYIYRLTHLGIEAQRRGRGIAFAAEVSRLIFGGTRDWHLGDHLAQATARAGLDLAEMDRAISDSAAYQAEVEANQAALKAAGHWGVPTFVYASEPFFGQDRIDSLRWRLKRDGITAHP